MSKPLTATQRGMLERTAMARGWFPGPHGASTMRSLLNRGLVSKVAEYGPYVVTDAGRAALEQGA